MENKQYQHNHFENIADMLWLSRYMDIKPVANRKNNNNGDTATSKPKKQAETLKQNHIETSSTSHDKDKVEFYPDHRAEGKALGKSATVIHSPKKLALSNYRAWEKAFKFINLKTASRNKVELDEDKTVENIAASALFDLTFRQQQERHFFLTLVIDRGDTMILWQELIKHFESMIYTMGVFSRISLYYWDTTQKNPVLYYDKALTRETYEKNITLDEKRNLIWIMTDCIGLAWKTGAAFKSIQRWSTKSLTSIMQMFPKEMWMGTMLYKGKHSQLSATAFNPLNKNLITQRRRKKVNSLKIPVISFNPYALQAWAKMVVNKQGNHISGVEFELNHLSFSYNPPPQGTITPDMRMKRFYSQASPTAQKLAFYMSVLPVDFQVTRILQEVYLKESNQAHVAEVFLGGLIEKKGKGDTPHYDFYPEIREKLNTNISADKSVDIMENMSDFVQNHLGIGVDFSALMHNPETAFSGDKMLSDNSIAYARIAANILQRKGGRFAENAAKINQYTTKLLAKEKSKLEKITKEDKQKQEQLGKANTYNERALRYYKEGKYKKALPLFKKAVAIREKTLGEQHLDTAVAYSNLAELYQLQANYNEALVLTRKALVIRKKSLGEEHPDIASSYNDLAVLYQSQGNYEQALLLCQKALLIREKSLGKEHPDTASSYNNLASIYDSQGNYTQALPLYEKALVIREKSLGKEHPHTASSYNNLAFLYNAQGNYAQALPLYKKALVIREKSLGKEHPDTAMSYHNLAELHIQLKNCKKAQQYAEKALNSYGQHEGFTKEFLRDKALLKRIKGTIKKAKKRPLYKRHKICKDL